MTDTRRQNARQTSPAPHLRVVPDPAGRPPPHDLDAEAAVLSAAMLEASSVDAVADLLSPEDFYSSANADVWRAVQALREAKEPSDIVTVASWLRTRDKLHGVGGASYLAQIADATPSIHNVEAHARVVGRLARRRRMIAECQTIAAEGYGDIGDEDTWADEAAERLVTIAQQARASRGESINDAMHVAIRERDAVLSGEVRANAIETGFGPLDELMCGGLHRGEVHIVTGVTGRGKSAFASCVAINTASRGHGVVYFMLEDTKAKLCMRMSCQQGRIHAQRCAAGKLSAPETAQLLAAASWIAKLPIVIDDEKNLKLDDIRGRCARYDAGFKKRFGFGLAVVIIDYLQLVNVGDNPRNRAGDLGSFAKQLQYFAEKSDLAIIELSQLNEEGLIFESRAVLHHAPNHWDLERDVKRASASGIREAETARVQIKKQRHGPMPDTAAMWFHPSYVLFSDDEFAR